MTLPDVVVERVQAGKMLAPSLREIAEADGTRYAVLDFIVEVPVERAAPVEGIQTVLGFDWGVRVARDRQCGRSRWPPDRASVLFWIPAPLMVGKRACVARLISSSQSGSPGTRSGIASRSMIRGVSPHEEALPVVAPGNQPMLAQVRGEQQRSGPSGGQYPAGARHRF